MRTKTIYNRKKIGRNFMKLTTKELKQLIIEELQATHLEEVATDYYSVLYGAIEEVLQKNGIDNADIARQIASEVMSLNPQPGQGDQF
jgi:hypothetical protein